MLKHDLKPKDFGAFLTKEGSEFHLELFDIFFQKAQRENITVMAQLESLLSEIILNRL